MRIRSFAILSASLFSATVFGQQMVTARNSSELQQAINMCQPGDTIQLLPGVVYRGNFVLPRKAVGFGWITIETAGAEIGFRSGTRLSTIEDVAKLAILESPSAEPVVRTAAAASLFRFRGIEFRAPGRYTQALVRLGTSSQTAQEVPSFFEFRHCWFHGDPTSGGKRGLEANATGVVVADSVFNDFFSTWQDTQAIALWNSPGSITLLNNTLEASGYPFISGGAAPSIPGLVPTGISVHGNLFTRPMRWKGVYAVKNLFELKNARAVTISRNIFENNWASAQNGFAILFTVRTCEAGDYPWSVVENVRFESNIVRNTDNGINVLGKDNARSSCTVPAQGMVTVAGNVVTGFGTDFSRDLEPEDLVAVGGTTTFVSRVTSPTSFVGSRSMTLPVAQTYRVAKASGRTANIVVRNNLIETTGRPLQVLSGSEDVSIANNTLIAQSSALLCAGRVSPRFVYERNVTTHGQWGFMADRVGVGVPAVMSSCLAGATFNDNVLIGQQIQARLYPGFQIVPDLSTAGIVPQDGAVLYELRPGGSLVTAVPVGYNAREVAAATARVRTGRDF